jgi:hypothetical protein
MTLSTGFIGVDNATGMLQEYAPPNVTLVPTGTTVAYGAAQTIAEGSSLPPGAYLVASSAGTLDATNGAVTVYPVTITGGPTPP